MSSEYNKLQESYKQLEVLKTQLENREVLLKTNLTDSQKETEQTKQEVRPSVSNEGTATSLSMEGLKHEAGQQVFPVFLSVVLHLIELW